MHVTFVNGNYSIRLERGEEDLGMLGGRGELESKIVDEEHADTGKRARLSVADITDELEIQYSPKGVELDKATHVNIKISGELFEKLKKKNQVDVPCPNQTTEVYIFYS